MTRASVAEDADLTDEPAGYPSSIPTPRLDRLSVRILPRTQARHALRPLER